MNYAEEEPTAAAVTTTYFLKWFSVRFSPALPTLEINGMFPSGSEVWGHKRETKGLPVIPATFVAPPPSKLPLEPLTGSRGCADATNARRWPQATSLVEFLQNWGSWSHRKHRWRPHPPPPPSRRRMSSLFNSEPRLLFLACMCSPSSADPTHRGFSSSLGTDWTNRRRKEDRLSSSPQVLLRSSFYRFRLSRRNVCSELVTADGSM